MVILTTGLLKGSRVPNSHTTLSTVLTDSRQRPWLDYTETIVPPDTLLLKTTSLAGIEYPPQ